MYMSLPSKCLRKDKPAAAAAAGRPSCLWILIADCHYYFDCVRSSRAAGAKARGEISKGRTCRSGEGSLDKKSRLLFARAMGILSSFGSSSHRHRNESSRQSSLLLEKSNEEREKSRGGKARSRERVNKCDIRGRVCMWKLAAICRLALGDICTRTTCALRGARARKESASKAERRRPEKRHSTFCPAPEFTFNARLLLFLHLLLSHLFSPSLCQR